MCIVCDEYHYMQNYAQKRLEEENAPKQTLPLERVYSFSLFF